MIRLATSLVAFVFAGVATFAQSHPQHPTQQHAAGHVRPGGPIDPALHALLHGNWSGTLSAPDGAPSPVALRVGTDEAGKRVFELTGAAPLRIGAITEVTTENHKVRWRQEMSGKPCEASADVAGGKPEAPELMKGMISCGRNQFSFQLTRAGK